MIQSGPNGPKCSKVVQMVHSGPKVQSGPKLLYGFVTEKFQKDSFFWDTLYMNTDVVFCLFLMFVYILAASKYLSWRKILPLQHQCLPALNAGGVSIRPHFVGVN